MDVKVLEFFLLNILAKYASKVRKKMVHKFYKILLAY